jgi:predicted neutral ceramidase superfamily lipid hydrolase
MKKSRKILYFGLALASLSCLVGFFLLISPEEKPLVYVFLPVIFVWAFLFSLVRLITVVVFKKTSRMYTVMGFVGVSFVVLIFLLSGVGQLTIRDVVLMSALALIGSFYFYRAWV